MFTDLRYGCKNCGELLKNNEIELIFEISLFIAVFISHKFNNSLATFSTFLKSIYKYEAISMCNHTLSYFISNVA